PGPERLVQSLQLDRAEVLDLDATERQPVRRRAEHELARLRRLLEPSRQRHRLAGREGRLGVVGDDLARLDPDARLELQLLDEVDEQDRGELAFHASSVETTGPSLSFRREPD